MCCSVRAWRGLRFNEKYAAKLKASKAREEAKAAAKAKAAEAEETRKNAAKVNPFKVRALQHDVFVSGSTGVDGNVSLAKPIWARCTNLRRAIRTRDGGRSSGKSDG